MRLSRIGDQKSSVRAAEAAPGSVGLGDHAVPASDLSRNPAYDGTP
jgi:hypothetical protein